MSINDTVKVKLEELQLERRLGTIYQQAERGVHQAVDQAAAFANTHQDRVSDWLDKAGQVVDQRTEGKYADQIDKVKTSITSGVSKLAQGTSVAADHADHAGRSGSAAAEPRSTTDTPPEQS